ncbi:ribose 5-phosphate isomerase B [bacterium]|nr:ribose 5-phosphate isomerase B [bacterium]
MKIAIASDHGGYELKTAITQEIISEVEWVDLGPFSDESVDYPDFADTLCRALLQNKVELGILICGTGIGISIRANRYKGIRGALVTSEYMAEMAKAHNNANVLCLGARTTTTEEAVRYIKVWLGTKFEAGRHARRVAKLDL